MTSRRRSSIARSATVLVVSGAVALAASAGPAVAQAPGGPPDQAPAGESPGSPAPPGVGDQWAVQPAGPDGPGMRAHFTYNVAPGLTLRDSVSIANLSEQAITFVVYPKDAYNTPNDAAFALLADDEDSTGCGSWITMEVSEYLLDPGRRVEIPFELSVPDDAEPGDHACGVIAANRDPIERVDQEGISFDVRQRVAARVYLRVEGPIEPALQIERLDVGRSLPLVPYLTGRGDAAIAYRVTNVGNVRLDSAVTLKITGIFGRTVKEFDPQDLPELLPGGSVVISEDWSGLPPVERLDVQLVVQSIDGQVTERASRSFVVIPWLVLLVVAALVTGYMLLRRRRRGDAPPQSDQRSGPLPAGSSSDEVVAAGSRS